MTTAAEVIERNKAIVDAFYEAAYAGISPGFGAQLASRVHRRGSGLPSLGRGAWAGGVPGRRAATGRGGVGFHAVPST